ncbi:TIR domain-containing protein [bacterium]|nr:TIR domain-containing protein [bacterium]
MPRISRLCRPVPPDCTVFVSHRRADQKAISPLWDFLRTLQDRHLEKLAVWSDGWGIPLEKRARWAAVQEIPRLLRQANILVFLLTSDFVGSPWCVLEVLIAMTQRGLREVYTWPGESLPALAAKLRQWDRLPSISHLAKHEQQYLQSMFRDASQDEERVVWQMKLVLMIGLSALAIRQSKLPVDLAAFFTAKQLRLLGGVLPSDACEAQAVFLDALIASGWTPIGRFRRR